jgi:hypothetical protein
MQPTSINIVAPAVSFSILVMGRFLLERCDVELDESLLHGVGFELEIFAKQWQRAGLVAVVHEALAERGVGGRVIGSGGQRLAIGSQRLVPIALGVAKPKSFSQVESAKRRQRREKIFAFEQVHQ